MDNNTIESEEPAELKTSRWLDRQAGETLLKLHRARSRQRRRYFFQRLRELYRRMAFEERRIRRLMDMWPDSRSRQEESD